MTARRGRKPVPHSTFGGPVKVLTDKSMKLPAGWKVSSRLQGTDTKGAFDWRIIVPKDIEPGAIRLADPDPRGTMQRAIERNGE